MQIIDPVEQTVSLLAEMLVRADVSPAAFKAARRAQALEHAVAVLRDGLAAMPPDTALDSQQREEIVRLLCDVVLFRIALADKTACLDKKDQ